jgi:hypothetical protein
MNANGKKVLQTAKRQSIYEGTVLSNVIEHSRPFNRQVDNVMRLGDKKETQLNSPKQAINNLFMRIS